MRTIVDIPEESLDLLAEICESEDISRAEAVRRAVDGYITRRAADAASKEARRRQLLDDTFGAWIDDALWTGRNAVEYVRQRRSEWATAEERRS